MYLLTFKKLVEVGGTLQRVAQWQVVGQSLSSSRVGALKAKAVYEKVGGQRCEVKELKEIRSINLDAAYLEETMR